MSKINLNIIPETKLIEVNGKKIKIPKLGLRHRMIMSEDKSLVENIKLLINSIHPGLSVAERDIVSLHILEFNGKIDSSKIVKGFEYKLDTLVISQKLKFGYDDYEFKFKSVTDDLSGAPLDEVLNRCCVYAKKNGEKIDIPNFKNMPAFVANWANQIMDTVEIDGPNGSKIKGAANIMGILANGR